MDGGDFIHNLIDVDASEREQLAGRIIVRRPNVDLDVDDAANHPEFVRKNLLYLLRLAPLTEENAQAKYGFTGVKCLRRFNQIVSELFLKGFPTENLRVSYVAAVEGFPDDHYVRTQVEHGIRNALTGLGLRLSQYATGEEHPGNTGPMAEMFKFVVTNYQGDELFDLYRQYAAHLEAARQQVVVSIRNEDLARGERLERYLTEIRARYQAYTHVVPPEAHPTLFARMERVLLDEERDYPLVPVFFIYSRALIHAAATFNPVPFNPE
ncbi:hypothetical protein DVH05_028439 [Phytophthora capsici]|nr:hypothetical protein DVH05_028439 [Phytophthora capsici]